MLVSIIDSYYHHVKTRMATVDASQKMAGVVSARDWPLTPPVEGAAYLLVLGHRAVAGTEAENMFEFTCQWTYYIQGSDIASDQRGQNRGDRYRRSMRIADNLRNASYPGFADKTDVSVDAQGVITRTPYTGISGNEQIYWSKLRFMPRLDPKSSILYEAATVIVVGIDDVLASVA